MRHYIFSLTFALSVFFSGVVFSEEMRTWTDDSGRFTVEAELDSIDGDNIRLKRADGKIVRLPLSKLSEADKKYVSELKSENPFEKPEDENPFEGAISEEKKPELSRTEQMHEEVRQRREEMEKRRTEQREEMQKRFEEQRAGIENNRPQEFGLNRMKEDFRIGAAKPVKLTDVEEPDGNIMIKWKCEPDPAPLKKYSFAPKNFTFDMSETEFGTFPKPSDFFINDETGETAFASCSVDMKRSKSGTPSFTRVFIGDTKTGKYKKFDSSQNLEALGISPDGKRLLLLQFSSWDSFGFGKRANVHVLAIEEDTLRCECSIKPFSSQFGGASRTGMDSDSDIDWAAWVDNKHFILKSGGEMLAMFDSSGNPIWKRECARGVKPEISRNGNYCINIVGNSAMLLETKTGESLGLFDSLPMPVRNLKFSFSPDGKQIASSGNDGIIIWDTRTGTIEDTFFISGARHGSAIEWVDDRYFVVDGVLVDTVSRRPVWKYTGYKEIKSLGGYSWVPLALMTDKRMNVFVFQMPHEHAVEKLRETADAAPMIEPGMSVSLKLDDSIEEDREKISESIKKKLEANGLRVVDRANITVALKVTEEPQETAGYYATNRRSPIPSIRERSTLTAIIVKPKKFHLNFLDGEEPIWTLTNTTKAPGTITPKELGNKSLQDFINEKMDEQKYAPWFENVTIPKVIAAQADNLGVTQITKSGFSETSKDQIERQRNNPSITPPVRIPIRRPF